MLVYLLVHGLCPTSM